MNANRSALILSASVVGCRAGSPCRFRVAFFKSLADCGPGGDIGHDLVVFAVHDQHRDGDLPEIVGEIGLREGTMPS
jgi:hypothetical protein